MLKLFIYMPGVENSKRYQDKLDMMNSRPEVENGRPEVGNGRPEVENGRPEVENGRPEVENGRPEVENGRPEVENGRPEVGNGRQEVENGRPEVENGRPEVGNGRQEVENGRPEVENGRPDLEVNNRRPKLKDIHSLQIFNWHGVGLELGLEDFTLHIIEHNHPRDLNGAKIDMLSTWLDQYVDATYGKLANALVAVGEEMCAEKLANRMGEWSIYRSYKYACKEPLVPTTGFRLENNTAMTTERILETQQSSSANGK